MLNTSELKCLEKKNPWILQTILESMSKDLSPIVRWKKWYEGDWGEFDIHFFQGGDGGVQNVLIMMIR